MKKDSIVKFVIIGGGVALVVILTIDGMNRDKSKNNTIPGNAVVEQTGSFERANFDKISNGMTSDTVKSILGPCDSISETSMEGMGKSELWTYAKYTLNGVVGANIYFSNDRVTMKQWTKL